MRVTEITSKDPGENVLLNYEYAYDKMDNILTKASEHGDYEYQYDDLYRLLSSSGSSGGSSGSSSGPTGISVVSSSGLSGGSSSNEKFIDDQVGNRLTSNDTTETWSYNANNELQGYDDVSYEYDENGSITQKTVGGVITKFFYNIEGRLERIEDGSSNIIAEY